MLKSLFGDLLTRPPAGESLPAAPAGSRRQAADLWLTDRPSVTLRRHFASRSDRRGRPVRTITLDDVSGRWAGGVLAMLADVSGRPVERLSLREPHSGEEAVRIERSKLARRADDLLKVYQVRVDPADPDAVETRLAMLERSDLGVVFLPAGGLDAAETTLRPVRVATTQPGWACPVLIIVAPDAGTAASAVRGWPVGVQVVTVVDAAMHPGAPGTTWKRLLGEWDRQRGAGPVTSGLTDTTLVPDAGDTVPPSGWQLLSAFVDTHPPDLSPAPGVHSVHTNNSVPTVAASAVPVRPSHLLAVGDLAESVLRDLGELDGLIFVALVDIDTGRVVVCPDHGGDIDRAAGTSAELFRLHRSSLQRLSHGEASTAVDEVLVTTTHRYHLFGSLPARPDLMILAVLDKPRSNLAATRQAINRARQVLR